MKYLWAILALALSPVAALAQNTAAPVQPGYLSTSGCPSPALTPCFIPFTATSPLPAVSATKGFGTLSATNASALLSTLTTGPNSAAWPTSPGMIYVKNSGASAGIAYVCPLGGACTAATGIPLEAGAAYGFNAPATTMTVIAASTASVTAQW